MLDDRGLSLFCIMRLLLQIQNLKQLLQIIILENNRRWKGSLVNKRKYLDGLNQILELVAYGFLCTDCIIQFTVYQAQRTDLLCAIFLARLNREEDDEVRRKSIIFPFLALMNLKCYGRYCHCTSCRWEISLQTHSPIFGVLRSMLFFHVRN